MAKTGSGSKREFAYWEGHNPGNNLEAMRQHRRVNSRDVLQNVQRHTRTDPQQELHKKINGEFLQLDLVKKLLTTLLSESTKLHFVDLKVN